MIRRSPLATCVVPVILFWIAGEACAEEWVHLDPLQGELILKFDGTWRSTESSPSSRQIEFEERLRLRQSGYSLDPRIATFSLQIEPVLGQGEANGSSISEDALNYSANISVLHGTTDPFSFNAQTSRSTGTTDGSLGSRTDFDTWNNSVAVNWKRPYFPTTLSYSERLLKQNFQPGLGGAASLRDDLTRTVRLQGRSSKTNLLLQRDELDDRIDSRNQDWTADTARFGHVFRWGRGSQLSTQLNYFDRTGFNEYTQASINESLQIRHTERLTSNTSYSFQRTEQINTTDRHDGSLRLNHQLYNNLSTSAFVEGSYSNTELITSERRFGGGLDFSYNKKFGGARVTAGIGGSYFLNDRETINGLLPVVGERQSVSTTTVSFLLQQRFVDQATIIITDAANPAAPPFQRGLDYNVALVSGDFTEIQIIPGGQINVNAPITLSIDYSYQSLPSQEFSTTGFRYNLGVDWGWLALFHRDSWEENDVISGASQAFLNDRQDTATGFELRWVRGNNRATFRAERRYTMNGSYENETYGLRQSITYGLSANATANVDAAQEFSQSDSNNTETDLYLANMSILWRPRSNLTLRPNVQAWTRTDEGPSFAGGTRDETYLLVGIDSRWTVGLLSLDLTYNHSMRSVEGTETNEDRAILTLRRRF